MAIRFAALASGSRGNSALVRLGGCGILIDLGLGPRALSARMESIGAGWDEIAAALLTHTHGDHVGDASLRYLARRGIPLYCHEGHHPNLQKHQGFHHLVRRDLVRTYDDRPFLAPTGMRVEPVELKHDGGPTFGFRIEGRENTRARPVSVGYLADTGCWWDAMADALTDVDLLGLEFNHDIQLQRRSGRSWALIQRNLGDRGHLSNVQGAELLSSVIARSRPGAVRHVVLLHLSDQCNRPDLALAEARAALRATGRRATIHVASQWEASADLAVQPARRRAPAVQFEFPWEAA